MGYSLHCRFFVEPGVEQATVELRQIAYVSVIDLPFRLALGDYFRYVTGDDGVFEVAGLNRFSLPTKKQYRVEDLPRKSDRNIVNTRVAVIQQPFPVNGDDLKIIRVSPYVRLTSQAETLLKSDPGTQTIIFPPSPKHTEVLRRFIELYYVHCPPRYQGHDLRPVWEHDFFDRHVVLTGCLTKPGKRVSTKFLKILLRSENPLRNEVDLGVLGLRDVEKSAKTRFARALRTEVPSLAERLWMLADSYAGHHNQEMAVITAVAAMEAAVNVYTRVRLEPHLGRGLTEQLLREQGMYTLIQALPKLLFPPAALPSEETTRLVLEAITARNALMHGKHDKSGKPTFFTKSHLGAAIYACGKMKKCFEAQTPPPCRKRAVKKSGTSGE